MTFATDQTNKCSGSTNRQTVGCFDFDFADMSTRWKTFSKDEKMSFKERKGRVKNKTIQEDGK